MFIISYILSNFRNTYLIVSQVNYTYTFLSGAGESVMKKLP